MAKKETALLEVENLSISFTQYTKGLSQKKLKVVNDLNIKVHEGEILAIVGSSGSGKSLLAHSILGILPENAVLAGKMLYKGEELTPKLQQKLRGKEMTLIPQSVNYLDPLMKVGKQVRLSVKNKANPRERQEKAFKKYKLKKEVDTLFPFQLSGGMARRVLISMATVSNANLIIADEPTPGLDPAVVQDTLSSIKDLANEGCGIIFITHDIHSAISIADKIAVFYAGRSVELSSAEDFSGKGERLRHPYTKALWRALPQNEFIAIPGFHPRTGEKQKGCSFYPRCDMGTEECNQEKPQERELRDGLVRCFHAT